MEGVFSKDTFSINSTLLNCKDVFNINSNFFHYTADISLV